MDFEDLTGWSAEGKQAVAGFERTREQQIWGQHVGKLTYRGTGTAPEVRLLPPQPLAISRGFDAVTLWCYGNNWGWTPDPSTPRVSVSALFVDAAGREFDRAALHGGLEGMVTPAPAAHAGTDRAGASTGPASRACSSPAGKNKDDRVLYFDNLAVFTEQFPPLMFEPRPERGIAMLPGQSAGRQHRARQAAVPHAARDHPARQPR